MPDQQKESIKVHLWEILALDKKIGRFRSSVISLFLPEYPKILGKLSQISTIVEGK